MPVYVIGRVKQAMFENKTEFFFVLSQANGGSGFVKSYT